MFRLVVLSLWTFNRLWAPSSNLTTVDIVNLVVLGESYLNHLKAYQSPEVRIKDVII